MRWIADNLCDVFFDVSRADKVFGIKYRSMGDQRHVGRFQNEGADEVNMVFWEVMLSRASCINCIFREIGNFLAWDIHTNVFPPQTAFRVQPITPTTYFLVDKSSPQHQP